jgi:regulatory protein
VVPPRQRRDRVEREPDIDAFHDALHDVPASDPVEVARSIALRQLTLGPRSRAQLEQALAARLVPDAAARTVLDRLEEVGLVDDAEYARMLVRTRQAGRGLARRALRHELQRKGVGEQDATDALADITNEQEEVMARDLVRRRLATMSGLPSQTQARRLIGMLARKGYSSSVASAIVWAELRDAADTADGESHEG